MYNAQPKSRDGMLAVMQTVVSFLVLCRFCRHPPIQLLLLLFMQVSKLTTVLLRACRTAAGSSSWDPLVAGVAVGKLVELQELDPVVLAGMS
jgi:hypothetical protein